MKQESLLDTGEHVCHARGCSVVVKPTLLMCLAHWRKVPRRIQKDVWDAYRPGQCDDKRPNGEWMNAASVAIAYVALLEGEKFSTSEARALAAYGGEEREKLVELTMKRLRVTREAVEKVLRG